MYGEVHATVFSLLEGTKTERLLASEDEAVILQREQCKASAGAIELAMGTSALMTQTVAQLMYALRVLSFC